MKDKQIRLLLFIQFFMYAALWIAVIELPVYISQKDVEGSLMWSHTYKGLIFVVWVFFQNITAIIYGSYADKIGIKKSLFISQFILMLGYILIPYSSSVMMFFISVTILGIGSGIFKPSLEGYLAFHSKSDQSHKIWSSYIQYINIAVITSTILIVYLEKISYEVTFLSSAVILLINLPLIYNLKERKQVGDVLNKSGLRESIRLAKSDKRMLQLVFIMTGFTVVYINFYEMLPNYILDWVDTSDIVLWLSLPEFMTKSSETGIMLSYQMIFMLNAVLVIFLVKFIGNYVSRYNMISSLITGLILIWFGCLFTGISQVSLILIFGIIVYSIGEMIVRPKFQEIISKMSPNHKESQYISFLYISYAIGYMFGALTGGILYDNLGEKSHLAQKALLQEFNIISDHTNALTELSIKLGLTKLETTNYLFNNYSPFLAWLPFLVILMFSIILLLRYNKIDKIN
jgi:MFS family permease